MRRANTLGRGGARKHLLVFACFSTLLVMVCIGLMKELELFDISILTSLDARCTGFTSRSSPYCTGKKLAREQLERPEQLQLLEQPELHEPPERPQQQPHESAPTPIPSVSDVYPTHVLVQPSSDGWRSTGEVIRVHRPFSLAPEKAGRGANYKQPGLSCTDFAGNATITTGRRPMGTQACRELLAKQVWEKTYAGYRDVMRYSSARTKKCKNSTVLIVPLSWRDSNVCHLLMKFLLAFNAYKRIERTPAWLGGLPVVSNIIIPAAKPRDHPLVKERKNFHGGLLHALFSAHGIGLEVVKDIPTLAKRRTCFSAAVFIGSHANRFAFPDVLLGPNLGYESPALLSTDMDMEPLPSRQFPLSSDAYALRKHIFAVHPRGILEPPRAVNKLLYVTRRGAGRRRWNTAGEDSMLGMLRDVALANGVKLAIFKGRSGMSFWDQVAYFQDAAVIVGFHGAGLSETCKVADWCTKN